MSMVLESTTILISSLDVNVRWNFRRTCYKFCYRLKPTLMNIVISFVRYVIQIRASN